MHNLLVVSDSSSLILSAKAQILNELCENFIVEIPESVFEETVVAGKQLGKIDALRIEESIENGKIVVKKVNLEDNKFERGLNKFNLDKGERESILLYLQTGADLLLVDDKQTINASKLLGINWATVVSGVVLLTENNKISCEKALESLRIIQNVGRYKLDFILDAFNKIEKLKEEKK